MAIEPISRTAVSDEVFVRLTDEILSGRISPDDGLPAERELAEQFGVNRHAVREALKRLQQSRLVHIAQGGKTKVLDWRRSAGLDVLLALVDAGVVPGHVVLRDVARMRRTVGADAARLCATQADDETLVAIREAAGHVGRGEDARMLVVHDLAFWDAVIDGSANLAYRLALNTLAAGFNRMGEANVIGLLGEYADGPAHVELASALTARDGARAHDLAYALLSRVVDVYDEALEPASA